MKTLTWDRPSVIAQIRDRIWIHLSPTATPQQLTLDASRLLQLSADDLVGLAQLQFMVSHEVSHFLADMPQLVRRLTTTTAHDEDHSAERIRGSIHWPATITARLSTGQPHMYVTRPARRAFQTPENALVAFTLNQLVTTGKDVGWQGTRNTGGDVASKTATAQKWKSHRAIQEIDPKRPTPRELGRISHGRNRRRYAPATDAYKLWQQLLERRDVEHIKSLIETNALVTSEESVLFEILCLFEALDALSRQGWHGDRLSTFQGGLKRELQRDGQTLTLWYQQVPLELTAGSLYRDIQKSHGLVAGALRPDLVIRLDDGTRHEWLVIECKLGESRKVEDSARASLTDLLAYRRAFNLALASQRRYGLGIAWGEGLESIPTQEIMLCTPDHIAAAITAFTG